MATKLTNPNPMLTIEQAAEWSGFSTLTIRRRIRDGILPASRFGARATRIRLEDLEKWLSAGDPQ